MQKAQESLATLEQAKQLGLLEEEFTQIKEILGRTPNFTEMSVYSVMWSEHCSYKNSIKWLKTLPKDGERMLVKAGEENAGLVDIGDGLACAFKIESHNHPSAIEPYQGAATGVGGINRDIFTMGARPIAQLNSLRFGNPKLDRTKWLVKGVSKGIGDYGNSFGIPTVGGEVMFDESFNTNPLVNAFSAGIVKVGKTISAKSTGVGNPVYIVGSSTGKDGIHGAAFASKDITDDSANDLPSVQVGDPFQEKLLLEATMELAETNAVVGMQDMGAAGITCSTCEMSAAGGHGMKIHLDKVPTRQEGMLPFEILLSESQERMLVVVKKGQESVIEGIFQKWDLNAVNIGEVTEGPNVTFLVNGEVVADVPAESLVLGGGAPVYEREYKEPAYYEEYKKFDINSVKDFEIGELATITKQMVALPNISSKRFIYDQYDRMVGTATMNSGISSDAGVVAIKGTNKALAMTVDCNSRMVHANPEEGCAMAVAEAARNLVCSGAEPLAVTNCLNFGNPYNPESYWQFVGAIKGMTKACERFKTPVTGGNVSFYNQTVTDAGEQPVHPTPSIGMIGLLENREYFTPAEFGVKGDLIFLVGHSKDDISCSEYLYNLKGVKKSTTPAFDLEEEYRLQSAIKDVIREKLISAAHDVSNGGLMVSLLEMAMPKELGFDIESDLEFRMDSYFFGEAPSRVVVSVPEAIHDEFIEFMNLRPEVPYTLLGHVTKGRISVDGKPMGDIKDYKKIYQNSLSEILEN
ncbi:phosphoribosylformylglycinamidine synthase subunit PurL [Luteibaculum oceani]|uniref:Phosphoribosylformylglycinamidine synthase subunit PurL n=1 Tax=Luteibaculum oceani TaxID=1294296 RepID=A0A5C6V455_9FLAO|nr:phosphoribosylformylglycinamidine synthase subunit PurL [Luteibaculum oceani]TXC78478.1 phosphoribosylformylglycinamidine synthase subunit PurL [Luteibaculum oceani]